MTIAITIVLPEPVAILNANRGRPSGGSRLDSAALFVGGRTPRLPSVGV